MGAAIVLADTPRQDFVWSPSPGSAALSLPEQIAEAVGNAIIRGQLNPGSRVHEQDLAERFGVSRGPVREAVRILERDGLVQILPRRGARVTELTIDEVAEVFELRSALLGLAVFRIAAIVELPAPTREAIGARIESLRGLARQETPDNYVQAVHELNLIVVDAGANRLLRTTFYSLAHRTLRYTRLGLATRPRRQQSARNWKALWSAAESRNGPAARQLAEALVLDSRDTAIATLRQAVPPGVKADEDSTDRQQGRDRLPDYPKLPRARPADGRRQL